MDDQLDLLKRSRFFQSLSKNSSSDETSNDDQGDVESVGQGNNQGLLKSLMSFFCEESKDDLFNQSLSRLVDYRQKLFSTIENVPIDLVGYQKFCKNFEQAVNEAKQFHKNLIIKKDNPFMVTESFRRENDSLLAKILILKRAKLMINLLQRANKSINGVDVSFSSIHRDVKKLSENKNLGNNNGIEILNESIRSLHTNYVSVLSLFNVLLRIGINKDSYLYKMFYNYIEETNLKIHSTLKEIFVSHLARVRWPLITIENSFNSDTLPSSHLTLFTELFEFLLEIELGEFKFFSQKPNDDSEPQLQENLVRKLPLFMIEQITTSNICRVLIPITLMAEPLVKRFQFYFMNPQSKLNSIENPEWYLCQVEQWISKNEIFLIQNVDPLLNKYFVDDSCQSSKYQLIAVLLNLVRTKIYDDLPRLSSDNRLFSLTIDEIIIFNKQIMCIEPILYEDYPELNPIKALLDNEDNFERFIKLEQNRLAEFIESIFEHDTSWEVVYRRDEFELEEEDVDEKERFIVCEAADKFALLIQNLMERSKFILDQQYQLKILQLILEMFDDFRLRLSQLIHDYEESWPFSQKFYSILNTFDFLFALIDDWNNHPFFMRFVDENGTFPQSHTVSNLLKTFRHQIEEIFERIIDVIISDVMFDLLSYKKLKWHGMSSNENQLSMSKSALNLFYNVSSKINLVKRYISANLFQDFLYDVAARIQNIIFERFILEHEFNRDGVMQLEYDIKHGLFSIFSIYLKNVEYTFSKLSDALSVLNFSSQTYHNLRARFRVNNEIEFKVYLQTIGIYSLNPSTVMRLVDKKIGFH